MRRKIISMTHEFFTQDDTSIMGYQTNDSFMLTLTSTDEVKDIIYKSDVWLALREDKNQLMTFLTDSNTCVTYYPRRRDEREFLRIEYKFVN